MGNPSIEKLVGNLAKALSLIEGAGIGLSLNADGSRSKLFHSRFDSLLQKFASDAASPSGRDHPADSRFRKEYSPVKDSQVCGNPVAVPEKHMDSIRIIPVNLPVGSVLLYHKYIYPEL